MGIEQSYGSFVALYRSVTKAPGQHRYKGIHPKLPRQVKRSDK